MGHDNKSGRILPSEGQDAHDRGKGHTAKQGTVPMTFVIAGMSLRIAGTRGGS